MQNKVGIQASEGTTFVNVTSKLSLDQCIQDTTVQALALHVYTQVPWGSPFPHHAFVVRLWYLPCHRA
jgi:hypothetical protein